LNKNMHILKNNGEFEDFSRDKLRESLLRASASILVTNDVISKVETKLREGMTTSEIYRVAFAFLKKNEKRTALKYSMKRSLLELGPTGFPFEQYVAEIFKAKGYKTKVGITLPGRCVSHEIDLIAYNDTDLILAEVKFHNSLTIKTDTKTALYVKARWDDMKEQIIRLEKGIEMSPTREILITNTKFTNTAEKYALCNQMGMISWDYPKKGNLYDLINETQLHPITTLSSLTNHQKKLLIQNDVITANQVYKNPELIRKVGLSGNRARKIFQEAKLVCGIE